jgi:hypothetical protein
MELFTILLSGLLGIFSPVGFVVDQVAAQAIRSQLDAVETLAVRVDNTPNYQLAKGKVERVRIAGRGLYPIEGVRIDTLELETDAIEVDPNSLRQGQPELEKPVNAGIRLVLTKADVNRALQSPAVTEQLRDLSLDFLGSSAQQLERYDFVNPEIDFLDQNRLRLQVALQSQQSTTQIVIAAETGIQINRGRQLQLVEPIATLDGRPLPPQFVDLLVSGIAQQFDLANLEEQGITARVLNWEVTPEELNLAAFVQIDPRVVQQSRLE